MDNISMGGVIYFEHPEAVAASLESTEKIVFQFTGEFGSTKLYVNQKNEYLKIVHRGGAVTSACKWKEKPEWWHDILLSDINEIKN